MTTMFKLKLQIKKKKKNISQIKELFNQHPQSLCVETHHSRVLLYLIMLLKYLFGVVSGFNAVVPAC